MNSLMQPEIPEPLARSFFTPEQRREVTGPHFTAVNNDCVQEMERLEDNSAHHILTSIPFSNHYEYTPSYNDFGHNTDNEAFFRQMDFLIPELYRVLKPGRVASIHVKDRILYGNVTGLGFSTVDPFSDLTSQAFRRHGFLLTGRRTITTDVVRENNQTNRLGWSECCKDSTKLGCGMSEYLLTFRKPQTDTTKGYADEPVMHSKDEYTRSRWQVDAHGYWRSSGDRLLRPEEIDAMDLKALKRWYEARSLETVYDYQEHVALCEAMGKRLPASFMLFAPQSWAEDVWADIDRMRTLNMEQQRRRQEMHVCPLQLDIVERSIGLYTNPGDLVLDPFGGIMTVPHCAVKMGRRGYGIELNTDYWLHGVGYCRAAEATRELPTLFDALESAA